MFPLLSIECWTLANMMRYVRSICEGDHLLMQFFILVLISLCVLLSAQTIALMYSSFGFHLTILEHLNFMAGARLTIF